MTLPVINELTVIEKFIFNTFKNDTTWMALFPNFKLYKEVIPPKTKLETAQPLCILDDTDDDLGAFGFRIKRTDIYQIKAVVQDYDWSKCHIMANNIERLFNWQNQIDPDAGRPRSQEVFIDPDDNTVRLMIMGMIGRGAIRMTTYVNDINYCHLGGRYEITYYQI